MTEEELLAADERRVRTLRGWVDSLVLRLMNEPMDRDRAIALVRELRAQALDLVPGCAQTFDLIYLPRLQRVIGEHVEVNTSRGVR